MADPISIIKNIATKQINDRIGSNHIDASQFKFSSVIKENDINYSSIESMLISDDSDKRWFRMGISRWGGSLDLIGE